MINIVKDSFRFFCIFGDSWSFLDILLYHLAFYILLLSLDLFLIYIDETGVFF